MIGSRVYGDAFVPGCVDVGCSNQGGCRRDICGEVALCGNADLGREREMLTAAMATMLKTIESRSESLNVKNRT